MALSNVASALLMGVFLVAVAAVVVRLRDWRQGSPEAVGGSADAIDRTLRSPATWTVAFLALVLVFVGGAVVFVGGATVPGVSQGALQAALGAVSVVLFVLYLAAGVYYSARSRGLPSSLAAGLGSATLGLLFLAAVVVMLFMAG